MDALKRQKIAAPAYIKRGVEVYKESENGALVYAIIDTLTGHRTLFSENDFFILEVLPGFNDINLLAGAYVDRFAIDLEVSKLNSLFNKVAEHNLFSIAAKKHPLLKPFTEGLTLKERIKEFQEVKKTNSNQGSEAPVENDKAEINQKKKEDVVAGVKEALGIDEGFNVPKISVFDPTTLYKKTRELILTLKPLLYLVPIIWILGFFTLFNNSTLLMMDLSRVLSNYNYLHHLIFGMFTINIASTMVQSFVAYNYRANIKSISIILLLYCIPRFIPEMSHVYQMNRQERLWLHGSSLITRAFLAALGLVLWSMTRSYDGFVQFFGLSLFITGTVAFVLTINPLIKSSGYHLLSVYLDAPMLRGKAYKALMNKIKGNTFTEANETSLASYALLSVIFTTALLFFGIYCLSSLLDHSLGGATVVIPLMFLAFLSHKAYKKLQEADKAYYKSIQITRWRNQRVATKDDKGNKDSEKKFAEGSSPKKSINYKYAVFVSFLAIMFFPYSYQVSGAFKILPLHQSQVATDIDGIINEVYYEGGEYVEKGKVIARLYSNDNENQVAKSEARIQEQQAILNKLLSKPLAEEVAVAQAQLDSAILRLSTSKAEFDRFEVSFKKGAVSLQDYDTKKRKYQTDISAVEEKRANLSLVKKGATDDEIAAAKAKVQRFVEEKAFYQHKVDHSVLYMPISGRIVTLHLKKKQGEYLNTGEPFAIVEDTSSVLAEINIPESDIGYVKYDAEVIVRVNAYHDDFFYGRVKKIDADISSDAYIHSGVVISEIDNGNSILKSGMTGYAKISGEDVPVWKAFFRPIIRFFQVEVWSWIP